MNYDIIKLLNLESINIDLDKSMLVKEDNTIIYNVVLKTTQVSCPNCGCIDCSIHDYRTKTIKHSLLIDKPCIIKYKARRYLCRACGNAFYENNPFCLKDEKVSLQTDLLVLEALRSHTSTFSSAAIQFNISVQTVINIFDKYVQCSRLPLPEVISIDEIYTKNMKKDKYVCVLLNFFNSKIIDMYPSRHYYTLLQNFQRIPLLERENVKYFIMDMWDPYKRAVLDCFPNALIAVDSFHILQHLNIAVDMVRLRTMRRFDKGHAKLEDADMYYYMLKKFHFFFKTPFAKIDEKLFDVNKYKTKWDKYTILGYLKSIDSELTKAYNLAEDYREFNYYCDLNNFEEDFENLVFKFSNSNIPEFYEFVKMIKRWKQEIKNSFIFINNKRLSNGKIEGCNSRLKILYKAANGYANFDRFRNRCMFAINKDTPIKNHHK